MTAITNDQKMTQENSQFGRPDQFRQTTQSTYSNYFLSNFAKDFDVHLFQTSYQLY